MDRRRDMGIGQRCGSRKSRQGFQLVDARRGPTSLLPSFLPSLCFPGKTSKKKKKKKGPLTNRHPPESLPQYFFCFIIKINIITIGEEGSLSQLDLKKKKKTLFVIDFICISCFCCFQLPPKSSTNQPPVHHENRSYIDFLFFCFISYPSSLPYFFLTNVCWQRQVLFRRGLPQLRCSLYHKVRSSAMRNGTESVGGCSSSTSRSSQHDTDDDRMIALVLSEEYAKLDGAVGRRLSNLAPVPHVPRINSYIPNLSDASFDHQRLLQRLNVYGLHEVKVSGDGNCQFRALSDQMYRSPEYHKHVRKEVVKQLKENRSLYEEYVPMKYKRYYKKMAKSGEWGDHVTLQAASDKFAAKICLLTSFRDTCFVEIVPLYQPPKRELWLSFWSEVHYNSLYEIRDAPIPHRPRKKHWLF